MLTVMPLLKLAFPPELKKLSDVNIHCQCIFAAARIIHCLKNISFSFFGWVIIWASFFRDSIRNFPRLLNFFFISQSSYGRYLTTAFPFITFNANWLWEDNIFTKTIETLIYPISSLKLFVVNSHFTNKALSVHLGLKLWNVNFSWPVGSLSNAQQSGRNLFFFFFFWRGQLKFSLKIVPWIWPVSSVNLTLTMYIHCENQTSFNPLTKHLEWCQFTCIEIATIQACITSSLPNFFITIITAKVGIWSIIENSHIYCNPNCFALNVFQI